MNSHTITLSRYIIEDEHSHDNTTGELSRLLAQIAFAAKVLAREFSRAALVGRLGSIAEKNSTGDAQKKLDILANNALMEAFAETKLVAGVVSEELDKVWQVATGARAKYLLCVDPLDGSSNTEVNGILATIFGIHRCSPDVTGGLTAQVLRKGSEQIAAGYVMYGASTILVYTCGHGVHGFTLDQDLGEFLLTHENLRCPTRGHVYSANLGHRYEWEPGVQRYIDQIEQKDPASNRPYSLRYSGALVADFHRSLIEGGLYFYPADEAHPEGKLRLLYECAPLAFVAENAGGRASTGCTRILDIQAKSIHQRVPLVIGSAGDVMEYEQFVSKDANFTNSSVSVRTVCA